MIITEVYKQLFYVFVIGEGQYQCGILCDLSPILNKLRDKFEFLEE